MYLRDWNYYFSSFLPAVPFLILTPYFKVYIYEIVVRDGDKNPIPTHPQKNKPPNNPKTNPEKSWYAWTYGATYYRLENC